MSACAFAGVCAAGRSISCWGVRGCDADCGTTNGLGHGAVTFAPFEPGSSGLRLNWVRHVPDDALGWALAKT
eukprot:10423686-Alexandrium_andersonii.AAC.1